MSRKDLVRDYLHFSRKDRIASYVIVLTLFILFSLPYFLNSKPQPVLPDTVMAAALDSLEEMEKEQHSPPTYPGSPSGRKQPAVTLFPFDPNSLDEAGWQSLGLTERTARTISRFREKGGRFRKREDLKKIWGLPTGFYDKVEAYITIDQTQESQEKPSPSAFRSEMRAVPGPVSLNRTDSTALIALPGIGPKLAARITAFRDKLGGFYSVAQVAETFGLPDSTFQKIRPYLQVDARDIKKININTAGKEELKAHPYIRWKLANAIVAYRDQHGPFKSLQELRNIVVVDNDSYLKIINYLNL